MKFSFDDQFLSEMSSPHLAWRWPSYAAWFEKGIANSSRPNDPAGESPFWWAALPQGLMNRYASAAFIEWRYFSILSPEFHGICGFSLFNPQNHFPQLSEGGLIVIVAGALEQAVDKVRNNRFHRVGEELDCLQEICFMHVFPMESVIFYGNDRQHMSASHAGIDVRIEMNDAQSARIQIEMEGGISLNLEHRAVAGSPQLKPVTATDFRTVPGAHWTIFNPAPIAEVAGTIKIRPGLLQLSEQAPNTYNPNFISPLLAQRLGNGYVELHIDNAAGYYEHSYGMNPMPLHGWDFLFAPCLREKAGLVMQTYRGSARASYLEVCWQQADQSWQTLHIPQSQCDVQWAESSWNPALRVHVPRKRLVTARADGYTVEVENKIFGEIPFIRAHSPVVRHFFIAEEFSLTSWRVTDQQGRVCVEVKDVISGGETARGRWYYNLKGLFSLSAVKPF